ncbi:hypothetical protein FACS1894180_3110 [Bacteroidia bacterium]|nr:hypothetical protein FACS1894180_3110 [Bacteroidia bacterium]
MKNILTLVFALLFCTNAFSQNEQLDVVYLTNGNIVRGIITEQTENQFVKIKTIEGNYVFPTSDIAKIEKATVTDGSVAVIYNQSNAVKDTVIAGTASNATAKTSEPQQHLPSELEREFYSIGNNDRAMLVFLQKHDYDMYQRFYSASRQKGLGKSLLNSGIALSVAGVGMYCFGIAARNPELLVFGALSCVAGEGLIIASIPVSVTAGTRKKSIKNNFARKYFGTTSSYQPQWNIQVSNFGIGVALNF